MYKIFTLNIAKSLQHKEDTNKWHIYDVCIREDDIVKGVNSFPINL